MRTRRSGFVDVEWGRRGQLFPVAVHIDAWDQVGLLRDISTMVAEEKVNMVGVRTDVLGPTVTSRSSSPSRRRASNSYRGC